MRAGGPVLPLAGPVQVYVMDAASYLTVMIEPIMTIIGLIDCIFYAGMRNRKEGVG